MTQPPPMLRSNPMRMPVPVSSDSRAIQTCVPSDAMAVHPARSAKSSRTTRSANAARLPITCIPTRTARTCHVLAPRTLLLHPTTHHAGHIIPLKKHEEQHDGEDGQHGTCHHQLRVLHVLAGEVRERD